MITADNYELYFFQYQEGMLGEADRREVEAFARAHPALAEELSLYAGSPRLTAEEMPMSGKETLKHGVFPAWWRPAAAAAAALLMAAGLWLQLRRPAGEETPLLAQTGREARISPVPSVAETMQRAETRAAALPAAAPVLPQSSSAPVRVEAPAPAEAAEAAPPATPSETLLPPDPPAALLAEAAPAPATATVAAEPPVPRVTLHYYYVEDAITYIKTPEPAAKSAFAEQAQSLWEIASALCPEETAPLNSALSAAEQAGERLAPFVKKIETFNQFIAKII